jgi:hypothetical protein
VICIVRSLGSVPRQSSGLPTAAVAQHPCMAKKPAPLKATLIKDTAVITACAAAIKGAPGVYAEELAERIYRAMTSVRAAK